MPKTPTILLVDDNEDLRASCATFLRDGGYRVRQAADAEQAMGALVEIGEPIEALVTDVNMPGEDGIRLVERIRQHQPGVPVVFISSHVGERLRSRLAAGDVTFLAKPFGPASLAEALATARRIANRADFAVHRGELGASLKSPARRWPRALVALAATVLLAIGLAFQLRAPRAPELPSTVESGVLRSIRVQPLFPAGTLEQAPATLAWRASAQADTYRVEIRRIGYDLVWQSETESTVIAIPSRVQDELDAGVVYTWRVEALEGESVIARSEAVRFEVTLGLEP